MLRISHDNKGGTAGWFLDNVTVDIPSRGEHVVFPCHRWLADDEDDGKIERELYPGQQTQSNPSNLRFCSFILPSNALKVVCGTFIWKKIDTIILLFLFG